MIQDYSRGCSGDYLRLSDYTWTGDLDILDCDENKLAYLNFAKYNKSLTYSEFMEKSFENIPGVFWPIIAIIASVSYWKQKKNIEKFEDENPEYFI